MRNIHRTDLAILSCFWVFFSALFLIYPSIDLVITDYFYDNSIHLFPATQSAWIVHANNLGRSILYLMMGFPFIIWIGHLLLKSPPPFSAKDILAFLTYYIFSVVILIEVFVKQLCLRPRPEQIIPFGGTEPFLSIFQSLPAGNFHSFVSGHASVWFGLICVGYTLYPSKKRLWTFMAVITGCLMGLGRIVIGKHFLSDVIFSGLFVFTACVLMDLICNLFIKRGDL